MNIHTDDDDEDGYGDDDEDDNGDVKENDVDGDDDLETLQIRPRLQDL